MRLTIATANRSVPLALESCMRRQFTAALYLLIGAGWGLAQELPQSAATPEPAPQSSSDAGILSLHGSALQSPATPLQSSPDANILSLRGSALQCPATTSQSYTDGSVLSLHGSALQRVAPAQSLPLAGSAICQSGKDCRLPLNGSACAGAFQPRDGGAYGSSPADSDNLQDLSRIWFNADFLLFWEKRQPLPAGLLTTGSPTDPFPGALGQPNTAGISPDEMGHGVFAGFRLTGGAWVDSDSNFGLEGGGFVLEDRGSSFGVASNSSGSPLLALTHTAEPGGTPGAFIIAGPAVAGGNSGAFSGGIVLRTDSQLWGTEGNALFSLWRTKECQVSALVGVRYLHLDEDLYVFANRSALNFSEISFLGQNFGPPFTGTASELTQDSFQTRNQFWGGQVGVRGEYKFNMFFLNATSTLALGGTEELSNTLGISTLQLQNSPPATAAGGLYALPSNSGSVRKSEFGIVPEVQLKAGVELAPWCRATVGYDMLYWNRVMRPGNQIDTNVDTRQVPTDPSYATGVTAGFPRPQSSQSSFWAQGITLGLEFRY